ncbi:MAG: M23 family metallopeptidase [Gammaproteobacteria bacterium]
MSGWFARALWTAAVLVPACASAAAAAAPPQLAGRMAQGGLVFGRTEPGAEVRLDARAVRVDRDGRFLLGFGRDAAPTAALEVRLPGGGVERRTLAIEPRRWRIQRLDGLPQAMVTPPPAVAARIAAEQARVDAARMRDSDEDGYARGLAWPAEGPITGVYGSQRILNGEPRQPHYGVDLGVPVGTPVRAPADGVISLAESDLYFTGGTLFIDHGHGLSSAFLHLSRLRVRTGERVRQGQIVAESGRSGRATGPHLDWRINLYDTRIDPELAVGVSPP